MIRLFLGNRVGVLLFLPFVIVIFHYLHWISGNQQAEVSEFGFWGDAQLSTFTSYSLAGISIFLNAVILNYLYNSHQFLDKNSYLTSLLYVILMSYFDAFYHFNYVISTHFLLIMMLTQLFELKQQSDGRRNVFNSFLFVGLASTFQPLIIFFFPFFILALFIFRPFSFREFTLALFGFAVPYAYCLTFLWWYRNENNVTIELSLNTIQYDNFIWTLLVYGILILVSYFSLRSRLQKSSIRLKKQIQVFWLFVLMGLFMGILNQFWRSETNDLSIPIVFITSLLTYSFLHKTYGLLSMAVFYIAFVYSMLKFFI